MMSPDTRVPTLLLCSTVFLLDAVTGKPPVYTPPPMYPYTLSYRLGEFQGAVFYGAPEGTAVAVSGTLGHEKYHPLYIGVDVKKTEETGLNPFLTRNSNDVDNYPENNKTVTHTHGLDMVLLGTTAFSVSGDGDILVQPAYEEYGLHSTIYFSVVMVQTSNGEFRSNPLSFVVEVVQNPNGPQKNKNAITAGILALVILFIAALTAVAMRCRNCRAEKPIDDQKSTSSSEEDTMDWKDHYHIKAEDSIIMGNQNETSARDSLKGPPRLFRSDSTLSWLKLHPRDEDDGDSGTSSLPTISEKSEVVKIDMALDFTDNTNGTIQTTMGHNKSILKKSRGNSRDSEMKRKQSKVRVTSDVKHDSVIHCPES